MNPPVSNAIQGAYLVAIVMTGLILGGAAIVFKEMTEGLGCLLGGFCFSMWLLVLKPGGLVTTTGGISGFIAAFTLASFATSFSHITRPYGLIVSISFAGATAVVLGIDCFSRAGLKEFWAYLWQLNDNLFPLGVTTYPLTRGLRVEIAAVFIIFLAGIVSQMKLWKVIEKRREERTATRLQDERTMEREEEHVAKRIERQNAQERNLWEKIYGDKDAIRMSENSSRDSGVGDMDSKKGPMSSVTSIPRSADDEIEMAPMSTPTIGAGLVMANNGQDGGPVIIRIAQDAQVSQVNEVEKPIEASLDRLSQVTVDSDSQEKRQEKDVRLMGADDEARLEKRLSQGNAKRSTGAPEIVSLPFKVPDKSIEDDRSSVATLADEEASQKRMSDRFSAGSVLLRGLSKRSQRNALKFSHGEGNSTEDLIISRDVEDDRASSVAATLDGFSDNESSFCSSGEHAVDISEKDVEARSAEIETSVLHGTPTSENAEIYSQRPTSPAPVGSELPEPSTQVPEKRDEKAVRKSLDFSTSHKSDADSLVPPDVNTDQNDKGPDTGHSIVSTVQPKPASITKDRLPDQLSKVVMSYRTNEWAKHLSAAEAPDLEDLNLEESPVDEEVLVTELAAPVNVEELQQTPLSALSTPVKTMSRLSSHVAAPSKRSSSTQSANPAQSTPGLHGVSFSRLVTRQSLHAQTSYQSLNTRGLLSRNSSSPNVPQPIVESPVEEDFGASDSLNVPGASKPSSATLPFGNSNTLMGKRDTMLRNKTLISPSALASTPELSQPQFQGTITSTGSDGGSVYNYPLINDDNMSLSARRELIRQSSLQSILSPQQTPVPFDSHQPRRQSSAPSHMAREQQLASWRTSVQNEIQSTVQPRATIERQRSSLWQERQAEEQKKAIEAKKRAERENAFDERMRRGDMLDAHREALRKMQASANRRA